MRSVGLICAALALGGTSVAAEQVWQCKRTAQSAFTTVPENMTIYLDSQSGIARVDDDITRQVFSRPIPVSARRGGRDQWNLDWEVAGVTYVGRGTRFSGVTIDYAMRLNTRRGTYTMQAWAYTTSYQGNSSGTCVLQ